MRPPDGAGFERRDGRFPQFGPRSDKLEVSGDKGLTKVVRGARGSVTETGMPGRNWVTLDLKNGDGASVWNAMMETMLGVV